MSVTKEQCKECYDNSSSFCIHGSPPRHAWNVNKQKSKAGDNAEITKLKFKIKKLKETLSDAQDFIKEPHQTINLSLLGEMKVTKSPIEVLKKIQRALHL